MVGLEKTSFETSKRSPLFISGEFYSSPRTTDGIHCFTPENSLQAVRVLKEKEEQALNRSIDDTISSLNALGEKLVKNMDEVIPELSSTFNEPQMFVKKELKGLYSLFDKRTIESMLDGESLKKKAHDSFTEVKRSPVTSLDYFQEEPDILERRLPWGSVFVNLANNTFVDEAITLASAKLSKNTLFMKTGSTDNWFPLYLMNELRKISPEMSEECAVGYWPIDEQSDQIYENIFSKAGMVASWGDLVSTREVSVKAEHMSVPQVIKHGPKLSFSAVHGLEESLETLCSKIVKDVLPFSQRACLSPRWLFVREGIGVDYLGFKKPLDDTIREYYEKLGVDKEVSPAQQGFLSDLFFDDNVESVSKQGMPWVVACAQEPKVDYLNHCVDHTLMIFPYKEMGGLFEFFHNNSFGDQEFSRVLQVAAYHGGGDDYPRFAELAGRAGATRITNIGRMAEMTQRSNHDGIPILSPYSKVVEAEL